VTLHPLLRDLRDERAAAGVRPQHELGVAGARAAATPALADPLEPVARREELDAGGVPVRIVWGTAPSPAPVLVYCFGGGWVTGDLDAVEPSCRRLANAARCAVAAVGYRLAPEHPFPAGLDDCFAATSWVAEHAAELGLDARRPAIGGASAGAALAALVCLRARDRGGPVLSSQLLVYPMTDYRSRTASMREWGDRYFLDARSVEWFWSLFLRDPRDADAASPLRHDLSGLPRALVLTAEYDPLRDEGELYAERLRAAGVPVEVERYDGMVHGFFSMSRLPSSQAAVARAADWLQRGWA
jgi:acetyl esterase/lipase